MIFHYLYGLEFLCNLALWLMLCFLQTLKKASIGKAVTFAEQDFKKRPCAGKAFWPELLTFFADEGTFVAAEVWRRERRSKQFALEVVEKQEKQTEQEKQFALEVVEKQKVFEEKPEVKAKQHLLKKKEDASFKALQRTLIAVRRKQWS